MAATIKFKDASGVKTPATAQQAADTLAALGGASATAVAAAATTASQAGATAAAAMVAANQASSAAGDALVQVGARLTQAQADGRYVRTVGGVAPDAQGDVPSVGGVGFDAPMAHADPTLTFDQVVARMPLARRDGYVFGTGVVGADGSRDAQGRLVVKSNAMLAQHFWTQGPLLEAGGPFSGFEFNAGGGYDLVCSSFTNTNPPAGSPLAGSPAQSVFAFEADALRLQQVLQYGSHQTYLVGNVTPPAQGQGINVNPPGGAVTTPITAFGRVAADIAQVRVGDIVSLYDKLVLVTGANQGAGTLIVEGLLGFYSGSVEVIADTWRNVQFHRFAAARTTSPTAFTTGAAGPFSFETPIPSQVVPGCVVGLSAHAGGDIVFLGHTRVKSIDRTGAKHTVTLERPIAAAPYANVQYVSFWPCVWTPQMSTKAPQGHTGAGIYALKLVATLPNVEAGSAVPIYTGAEVTTSIASQPLGVKQDGAWYAAWFNVSPHTNQPFLDNGKTNAKRTELDKPWELFPSRSQGGNVWTGNTHARGIYRDENGNIIWDYMMQAGDTTQLTSELMDGPMTSGDKDAVTASLNAAIDSALSSISQASRDLLKTALDSAFRAYAKPLLDGKTGPRIHAKEELAKLFSTYRTRILNAAGTDWRIPGSHWVGPGQGDPSYSGQTPGGVNMSRGTHQLILPASHRIMSGQRVETGVVWTREWSIAYIHGEPICISWWDAKDEEMPYTFILTVLGHAVKGWAWGNGFFNRDTAHIAEHWMRVHEIDIWRGA